MKITKNELRAIIKEEIKNLSENIYSHVDIFFKTLSSGIPKYGVKLVGVGENSKAYLLDNKRYIKYVVVFKRPNTILLYDVKQQVKQWDNYPIFNPTTAISLRQPISKFKLNINDLETSQQFILTQLNHI